MFIYGCGQARESSRQVGRIAANRVRGQLARGSAYTAFACALPPATPARSLSPAASRLQTRTPNCDCSCRLHARTCCLLAGLTGTCCCAQTTPEDAASKHAAAMTASPRLNCQSMRMRASAWHWNWDRGLPPIRISHPDLRSPSDTSQPLSASWAHPLLAPVCLLPSTYHCSLPASLLRLPTGQLVPSCMHLAGGLCRGGSYRRRKL